jgi:protein-S-isoprenylcysteine O-methyltransferase Ste14
MTITTVLAYLLIVSYFVMERSLRKGQQALNLNPGLSDAGSSKLLWLSGIISILLVMAAPALNHYQIGDINFVTIGWLGLFLMLLGLAMRYWAAKILGKFYTRTLQIIEDQRIVDQAPYNIIRHPGYLGTFLMEMGAGLAIMNWILLLVIVMIGMMSRAYRISAEETMLEAHFAEAYKLYSERTWKLIPFLY